MEVGRAHGRSCVDGAPSQRLTLLFVALLSLLAFGCDDAPKSDRHAASEKSAARPSEQRVVSLSPSTTEAMFAIGADALLVGRSKHCDYPAQAKKLPSVGGFANPNLEAILALEPTVVIGSQSPAGPALEDKLRAHGMQTFFDATDSAKDVWAMIRSLGARFDKKAQAAVVEERIRDRMFRIEEWGRSQAKVRVVMVFDVSPLFVAGPGSFADELIEKAGADNAIDAGGKWPTIDAERLLTIDPDVIIDAVNIGHGSSDLSKTTGWSELKAIKQGQLRRLQSAAALRPGPRIAEGLADVARAIYNRDPP